MCLISSRNDQVVLSEHLLSFVGYSRSSGSSRKTGE